MKTLGGLALYATEAKREFACQPRRSARRKCTPSSMRSTHTHTVSSPINIAGALPLNDLVLLRGGRPRLARETPLEGGRAPLRAGCLLVQEDDRGACVGTRDDGAG